MFVNGIGMWFVTSVLCVFVMGTRFDAIYGERKIAFSLFDGVSNISSFPYPLPCFPSC